MPRIALTATADQRTRTEIAERLDLTQARHFVSSFDRPNIQYRIERKDGARNQLLRLLRAEHAGEAGIVYCLSRNKVDRVAEWLCQQGINALPYHAGLSGPVRENTSNGSCAKTALSWWPPLPSAWASTNQMYALSRIWIYPKHRVLLSGNWPCRP